MATSQSTIDYLIDQLSSLGLVSAKKMFGEYCLYVADKPIGLICDDRLFIKPTKAGASILLKPVEQAPYQGAKNHYLVSADRWEDREWISRLVSSTANELPAKKLKEKRREQGR